MTSLVGGIEIGGTKTIVLVARGTEIAARAQFPTGAPAATLQRCVDLLAAWQDTHGAVAAIGIASFGPLALDPALPGYGCISNTPKPGWAGVDLRTPLLARFPVPLGIDTDVAGAALAEGCWGASVGSRVHVYLTIGTGIGAGVVVDGNVVRGLVHSEAGHIRVRRSFGDEFAGICSYHGDCLEGLASGPAIAARAGSPAGDLAADHPVWMSVAADIAELTTMLLLTLSAERIVIGGGVAIGQPQLLPMIRARTLQLLAGYIPAASALVLETLIVLPLLGKNAGPLGAIAIGERALMASA